MIQQQPRYILLTCPANTLNSQRHNVCWLPRATYKICMSVSWCTVPCLSEAGEYFNSMLGQVMLVMSWRRARSSEWVKAMIADWGTSASLWPTEPTGLPGFILHFTLTFYKSSLSMGLPRHEDWCSTGAAGTMSGSVVQCEGELVTFADDLHQLQRTLPPSHQATFVETPAQWKALKHSATPHQAAVVHR